MAIHSSQVVKLQGKIKSLQYLNVLDHDTYQKERKHGVFTSRNIIQVVMKTNIKQGLLLPIVISCISIVITGCGIIKDVKTSINEVKNTFDNSKNKKNPLSGKDTDERIIMSLEKTYPEHTFSVVKPYKNDKGVCEDENGIQFKVHGMLYNNMFHFGLTDDYLYTLLEKQDFVKKVQEIVEQYGFNLRYSTENRNLSVMTYLEEENSPQVALVASMVKDILNSVEVPEVVYADTTFSTGVVNYFTDPDLSGITIFCDDKTYTSTHFTLEDKDKTLEELEVKLNQAVIESREPLE